MENKRVVVELKNNLTFCGMHCGNQIISGKDGIFVETDSESGLKIWCPKDFIKEIITVPVEEREE